MIRLRQAPLGPPFWAPWPLWRSLEPRPCSFTPQNRMIILPPAHTIGRGWPPPVLRNQGWGGVKGLFAAEISLT